MKNISNEAICTSANGKDIITEIREPLGRGIDHPREAVAILGVSFRVRMPRTLLKHIQLRQSHFRPTMWTRQKCRVLKNPAQPVYGRTLQRSRVLSASCTNLDACWRS